MSVLKQNPFLAGFGAVMVVCVGALGYLTYSASQDNSDADSKFQESKDELSRLQGSKPSPTDAVLKQVTEQKTIITGKRDALRKELAAIKIKDEPITGGGFQDRLKTAVAQLGSKVGEANVVLPGGKEKTPFYLGFNQYQSEPPKETAAPILLRQLRAIELLVNILVDTKNVTLTDIVRPELPEEKTPKAVAVDPKNKPKQDDEAQGPVQHTAVTLKFQTAHENFQNILNGIVSNKQQLFVIRRLVIENEQKDAPQRSAPGNVSPLSVPIDPVPTPAPPAPNPDGTPAPATPPANPAAPPAAPPNPAVPTTPVPAPAAPLAPAPVDALAPPPVPVAGEAPKTLQTVFGRETLKVTMDIEIVSVADPETTTAPTAQRKEK